MFGSTWVSCSPWAVQGDGSQDLGVLGSHPPVPLVRPPHPHTQSPHIPQGLGSVCPPRAADVHECTAQGILSPSQLGPWCLLGDSPRKRPGELSAA